MHEAGEIGVVEKAFVVFERGAFESVEKGFDAAGEVGDEVFAEVAAGVGEAVGIEARFRHLEKADGLDTSATDDDHFAADFAFGFGFAVEEFDAGDFVVAVDGDFADDGVGDEFELAGFEGGEHVDVVGIVLGDDVAAGHAVAAEVAGGAAKFGAAQCGFANVDGFEAKFAGAFVD